MFDFLGSIFRHSFWTIIIVVLVVLGALSSALSDVSYKYKSARVRSAIRWGRTEKAAERLHDYYVDDCHANPHSVSSRMGAIAEEAIGCCIAEGDSASARQIYREFELKLSDYAKQEYSGLDWQKENDKYYK